jgi:hypothetical protein
MISEKAPIAMQGWEMAIFSMFVTGGWGLQHIGKNWGDYWGAFEADVFGAPGVVLMQGCCNISPSTRVKKRSHRRLGPREALCAYGVP